MPLIPTPGRRRQADSVGQPGVQIECLDSQGCDKEKLCLKKQTTQIKIKEDEEKGQKDKK